MRGPALQSSISIRASSIIIVVFVCNTEEASISSAEECEEGWVPEPIVRSFHTRMKGLSAATFTAFALFAAPLSLTFVITSFANVIIYYSYILEFMTTSRDYTNRYYGTIIRAISITQDYFRNSSLQSACHGYFLMPPPTHCITYHHPFTEHALRDIQQLRMER